MRYQIANLGETEPARFVPEGTVDCSNVSEFRKAVDNAAARIAYYQQAMQQASASENYGAVDHAKAGADQANHDWEVWSKALKKCEGPLGGEELPTSVKRGVGVVALGALAIVGIAVITIVAAPKVPPIKFWNP